MLSSDDLAVYNRLGLTSVNGTITMSLAVFGRALDLARLQQEAPRAGARTNNEITSQRQGDKPNKRPKAVS